MSTQNVVHVTGMTCEHCVRAVTDEVAKLPGVMDVSIVLDAGGSSAVTVTSNTPLDIDAVRDAVDEAGYELAEPTS